MKSLLWLLLLFPVISLANDRITRMEPTEQCIYRARLAAAGAFLRIQEKATACSNIPILWHGDETENEREYISRWLCAGFKSPLNPVSTGDEIFKTCMKELGA